jgi:hypothetical protein
MKTIADVIEAKKRLEKDVLDLIKSFEQTYGVHVSAVLTDTHFRISSQKPSVYFVECKVEL